MISIAPKAEVSNEFKCPIIDRETEQYSDRVQASAEGTEQPPIHMEFDLFAEARQIYARARGGRRVRSSSII